MNKKLMMSLALTISLILTATVPAYAEAVHSAEIGVWARIVTNDSYSNNNSSYSITIEWDESDDSIIVTSENDVDTALYSVYNNDEYSITVNISPAALQ